MLQKGGNMDLNILKNIELCSENKENLEENSCNKDIAIVGIDAKIAGANNVNEFWQYLVNGCDMIRDFPEERIEDANNICLLRTNRELSDNILPYGYLDQIDLFDPDIFGISNKEAELMDPAQRIFLQSAWKALEDAGYGGNQIKGTNTGVYVGINNIQNQYCATMDDKMDPATYGLAVSGNVNSIVASRISYHFDLKGPAVVFDTACSSSLVAVYFACQQLRTKEVSMAIVGGIRLCIIPPQGLEQRFGIEALSGRTRSFDANSDGTGGGEGVVTMVLKPLEEARKDNDHIYAVIKGASINQNGTLVGITAPNALAQEDVIKKAWKDAEINPETISYIEAHGTATELGDPIEISGIEKAFRNFTHRNQFCAIGSVKSNVGHLDSTAGMAGLLKVVLMLQHKKIPASLHFKSPNKKINFIQSPVYVNDRCVDWRPENSLRRAGISSFGISGTNCHLVLEEAIDNKNEQIEQHNDKPFILTVSAKNQKILHRYINEYKEYLASHPTCNLRDFCYTANTGRQHYNVRYIIIFNKREEFLESSLDEKNNYLQEFKVVEKENNAEGYITIEQQKNLTKLAKEITCNLAEINDSITYSNELEKLCKLYVQGADVDWNEFYINQTCNKISIPTYPYNNRRFWHTISPEAIDRVIKPKKKIHPLVDACILDSYQIKIYEKVMSTSTCWELREHMINGEPVLPGSALIEMAFVVGKQIYKTSNIEFSNLQYINPLYCPYEEERLIHIIAQVEDEHSFIRIVSKGQKSDEWISHLEVTMMENNTHDKEVIQVMHELSDLEEVTNESQLQKVEIASVQGEHWNNLDSMYLGTNRIALLLNIKQIVPRERMQYFLYPPALDSAINAGTYIVKGEYLPFSFSKAIFYRSLPDKFYSFITKKASIKEDELISFDIILCDKNGEIIAKVQDYMIRRIEDSSHFIAKLKLQKEMFHKVEWTSVNKQEMNNSNSLLVQRDIIVFCRENQDITLLKEALEKSNLIVVRVGLTNKKESDSSYYIRNEEEDFYQLFNQLKNHNISMIIQYMGYDGINPMDYKDLQLETQLLLKSTMLLTKAFIKSENKNPISLIFITKNAEKITENDQNVFPISKSLTGMGVSIEDEYSNIKVRTIDVDKEMSVLDLHNEICFGEKMYSVAYRKGTRYLQKMKKISFSEKINNSTLNLHTDGVYVIAGGLGGMGLAITKYLFEIEPNVKIAILNRSFTEEDILEGKDDDNNQEFKFKREAILKLKNEGKKVEIVKVDISRYNQLNDVFVSLRNKYSKINGVINAAGVPGDGFILNKNWDTFEETLKPKIYGSWNLDQVTRQDNLEFFVLCSSMTSIFGAPGQSDYAAANAFLDSFSFYRKQEGKNSLTIDWTGWSDSGMAVRNGQPLKETYVKFLSDEEGVLAFLYALKTKEERIMIGEFNMDKFNDKSLNLNNKIKIQNSTQEKNEIKNTEEKENHSIDDIVVIGKNIDELTEIEKKVIIAWSNVLNTNEVDVYDKFFEIGGNSLLALNLQKELNESFNNLLVITDIFVYSTIIELSEYINSKVNETKKDKEKNTQTNSDENEDLDELLTKFMNGEIDYEHMLDL